MDDRLIIKDSLNFKDSTSPLHRKTLWVRTEVIGGYGRYKDKNGVSQLNEVVFRKENMVPIGGVQYAMEKIFNISGSISTGYISDVDQLGVGSPQIYTSAGIPYPSSHCVCLFGVGIGGAGANSTNAYDVSYTTRSLEQPIPFKFTDSELSPTDADKYYGKKLDSETGLTGYYLKKFDSDPTIRHLWKDGVDDEDGSEVASTGGDSSIFDGNLSRTEGIETFTEILLTIKKSDVKPWFAANGKIEETRINELALFSAMYDSEANDYAMVKLFSKVNLQNEPLTLAKDMKITYRVYGS